MYFVDPLLHLFVVVEGAGLIKGSAVGSPYVHEVVYIAN